jgi:hypothetical protein
VSSGTTTGCLSSPLDPAAYRWRARTVDTLGAASAWVSYGGNAETATDFRVVAGGAFALADLAGTWYLTIGGDDIGQTNNNPWWAFGTMQVGANGAITTGSLTTSFGETSIINSGSLTLTDSATGTFEGSFGFQGTTDTVTIEDGKLDSGKTRFGAVGTDTGQSRWLAVGTKGGGSFSPADLQGTWYMGEFGDSASGNGPFWSWVTVNIDSSGNITGGTGIDGDGEPFTVTGGALPMDAAGVITGGSGSSAEGTVNFPHGKMDPDKNLVSLVTSGGGDFGTAVLVKGGGSFATADLAGTWNLVIRGDETSVNEPFADAGSLVVSANGTITGGGFFNEDGGIDAVGSGSLTINGSGIITGSFSMQSGGTVTISHGKLDAGKTTFVAVGTAVDIGESEVWIGLGAKQ